MYLTGINLIVWLLYHSLDTLYSIRCTHPDIINDSYNGIIYNNSQMILFQCKIEILKINRSCNQWVFDKQYYQTTLTEEVFLYYYIILTSVDWKNLNKFKWGMVCDRNSWRTTVQTIYFSGVLIGSLVLGFLADRFLIKTI